MSTPIGPDGFTRLAGDAAYDRLHGADGHVQAATPDAGDVEALAKVWSDQPSGIDHQIARAVLASDWLASHDAATADRVRRETAEGIAAAIEAERDSLPPGPVTREDAAYDNAARIAREAGR